LRILVTRPAEDGEAFAHELRQRGIDALLDPLLTIEFLAGPPLALDGVQAVLVTSANGIRAFAARDPRRAIAVYAVGASSAACARALGFDPVFSAAGDVAALAHLVTERLDPNAGAVLHVAGSRLAGDLAGALEKAGFAYRRAVLYEARTASALAPETAAALLAGTIDGVALFSPRTATTFVALVGAAGLTDRLGAVTAFCLSAAVATAARGLAWRAIAIAAHPDKDALVATIVSAGGRPSD
jgi:uroporphyrinogen-III synthase